jgi:hypothetical protein
LRRTFHDPIVAYSTAFLDRYVRGSDASPLLTHPTSAAAILRYRVESGHLPTHFDVNYPPVYRLESTMSGDRKSPAAVPVQVPAVPVQVPVPTAARPPAVRREGAVAIGATAIGALALGALAVGALAIAKLVIGQLVLSGAKLREGRVDELRIARLIIEDLRIEHMQDRRKS